MIEKTSSMEVKKTMKAKEILIKYCRSSIDPTQAKKICKAFDVDFNKKLIYTKLRYRELADESKPRVQILDLTEDIAKSLNIEADKQMLELAKRMHGVGSYCDAATNAWAKNLPDGEDIEE